MVFRLCSVDNDDWVLKKRIQVRNILFSFTQFEGYRSLDRNLCHVKLVFFRRQLKTVLVEKTHIYINYVYN